jgi:hypothetical protein
LRFGAARIRPDVSGERERVPTEAAFKKLRRVIPEFCVKIASF